MLPKHHILLGLCVSLILLFYASPFYALLFFLASVFIDVDHYFWYVGKKKDFSLRNAYYFLKSKKNLRTLMLFHTIEFHILILGIGIFYSPFLFLFGGMLFHSLVDVFDMYRHNRLKDRRFSLIVKSI